MIKGKTAADKAQFIITEAAKHGWKGTVRKTDDATLVRLDRNGNEQIEIRYDGNSIKEEPVALYDGQVRRVHNVAAAFRIIEATPEENAAFYTDRAEKKVGTRKAAKVKRAPGARARKISFTAEDEEETVKAKLLGRKLVWTNRISGELEQDVVSEARNHNGHFYVRKGQVSFVGDYGFRTVQLDQLVAVR